MPFPWPAAEMEKLLLRLLPYPDPLPTWGSRHQQVCVQALVCSQIYFICIFYIFLHRIISWESLNISAMVESAWDHGMICSILARPRKVMYCKILPQCLNFCPNSIKLCKIHRKGANMIYTNYHNDRVEIPVKGSLNLGSTVSGKIQARNW